MRRTFLCLLSLFLLTGTTADAKRAFEIAGAPPWDLEELARNRAFGKDGGWTSP